MKYKCPTPSRAVWSKETYSSARKWYEGNVDLGRSISASFYEIFASTYGPQPYAPEPYAPGYSSGT